MRKMMTKEVTKTLVQLAIMEVNEQGMPVAKPLEPIELIGNVSTEKAQKVVQKMFTENVTVFGVNPETQTYEMEVSEFIKLARIKGEEEEENTEEV